MAPFSLATKCSTSRAASAFGLRLDSIIASLPHSSSSLSLPLSLSSSKSNAKNNAIKIFREISSLWRTHVSRQRNFYCSPTPSRRTFLLSFALFRFALCYFFGFFFKHFRFFSKANWLAQPALFRLLNLMGLPDFGPPSFPPCSLSLSLCLPGQVAASRPGSTC